MMAKVTRDSLMTLEAYAKARPDFRKQVIGHKKHRAVRLGEHWRAQGQAFDAILTGTLRRHTQTLEGIA